MYTNLLIALSLMVLVEASGELRHLKLNNIHMFDSGARNYAMTSPNWQRFNWRAISVNGDNFAAVDQKCRITRKSFQALTPAEKSEIYSIMNKLVDAESDFAINSKNSVDDFSLTKYPLQQVSPATTKQSAKLGYITADMDDEFMTMVGDVTCMSKAGLPNNMIRVCAVSDLVLFSYANGEIRMKPTRCLHLGEINVVNDLKLSVKN